MRCTNSEGLDRYLSEVDSIEKENEKYEAEFLEVISDLKKYAMKLDKLELLKELVREEFNLWKQIKEELQNERD